MRGKDPRDAHFVTRRICGICRDNHATCATYAQNMAFGVKPSHLAGPMDGITAADLITRHDGIPVVFLTAHADAATTQHAQAIGPFGYVLKPFDQRELHVAIEIGFYRGQVETELRRLNRELQEALDHMKTLQGMLPICAWCKKIRDDQGEWETLERYLASHSEAKLTHGICPECAAGFVNQI